MLTTAVDIGIPPTWNLVVMSIRAAQFQDKLTNSLSDVWQFHYNAGNALTTANTYPCNSIEALGWTPTEALETHLRLQTFAEDWDAPGMEVYDDL